MPLCCNVLVKSAFILVNAMQVRGEIFNSQIELKNKFVFKNEKYALLDLEVGEKIENWCKDAATILMSPLRHLKFDYLHRSM